MPTVRYQIRNEYGLADPELYQAADKDDPEAVLEGVAMAGLVGVLRQLGDLAEFAAEVFHVLHEEVTSTASRGHGLMLRVQQLEADFPSIEKAFLVQTNYSQFAYNDGVDWHVNLRMDQNLLTQGDMPRFVLDSYEECRGPPRLFMLDKFDVAGAGACLKRYSDPSSFKVEFTSSGMMEEEVQWENKPRKVRKKAPRLKNGETTASFLAPLINSNLQADNSDHASAKVPARRVKLKSRNLLDSDITNRKSYMEHLLEPEQVWPENSIDYPEEFVKSIDSGALIPQAHEIAIDNTVDSPIERANYSTATRKEVSYFPADKLDNHEVKSTATSESTVEKRIVIVPGKTESFDRYMSDDPEKKSRLPLEVDPRKPFTDGGLYTGGAFTHDKLKCRSHEARKKTKVPLEVDHDKYLTSFEFNLDGEDSEHRSDDISSDLENYVDALNSMESEVETDRESKAKSEKGLSNVKTHRIDSSLQKKEEFPALLSMSATVGESTASSKWSNMLKHPSETVISDDLSDIKQPLEDVSGFYVRASPDNLVEESPDKMLDELQGSHKKCELLIHLLPNGTCYANESDITSINSIVREGSSRYDNMYPEENDEAQVVSLSDDRPGYVEGSCIVSHQSGCKMEERPGCADESNNSSGGSTPLSETADLSLGRNDVLQVSDPAECGQEQISEEGIIDMSDHLSEAKDKNAFEEIPTKHMGESTHNLTVDVEGHQVKSGEEAEACLDERALLTIPGPSFEIDSTIVHRKVLNAEISNNDVRNTSETIGDLDNTFLNIDDVGDTEPIMKSRVLSDDLWPFSNSRGPHCTADAEPLFSDDMVDIQGETVSEGVPSGHVEDVLVSNLVGALEDPMEPDNKACFAETMPPLDPVFFLEKDQFTMQPDVLHMEVRNIDEDVGDNSAEGMEESKSSSPNVFPCELEYSDVEEPHEFHEVNSAKLSVTPQKEVFLDDMHIQMDFRAEDAGKLNTSIPNANFLELELSSTKEEPQESPDEDSAEHLLLGASNAMVSAKIQLQNEGSGLTVSSDAGEPRESHDTSLMVCLHSDIANGPLVNNMQLPNESGLMVTSEEDDPTECLAADSPEHFSVDSSSGNSPEDVQLQNGELNHLVLESPGFSGGSASFDLHKESVQLEKNSECVESDDSSDEYVVVGADDSSQSTCSEYSEKASGLYVQLQENYLAHDAVLDRQDMEVRESSDVNNLISSLQNESILTAAASSSDLPVLCSFVPSDTSLILSDPDIQNDHMVSSLEDDDFGPKEGNSPSSHLAEDGNKPISVSPYQDSEHLESLDGQLHVICTADLNLTQTISKDNAEKPSIPEPHAIVSSGETNELGTSLSKMGSYEKVEDEDSVAFSRSSESLIAPLVSFVSAAVPVACSVQNVGETGPQEASTARHSQFSSEISPQEATVTRTSADLSEISLQKSAITSSSHTITENSLQEIAESRPGESTSSSWSQDRAETPPLPPLPPIEWTLGKSQFGSLTSNGDVTRLPAMTSPFIKQIKDEKHPQGPQATVVEMVQPETSFTSSPPGKHEQCNHGLLSSEGEIAEISRLPELPPITDERRHHASLILEEEVRNTSNPHVAESYQGDGQYSIDQVAAVPEAEVEVALHPQLSKGEGQLGQHRRLELGHLLPSLELESSQYAALNVASDLVLPGHPFFIGSSAEEWKHQYGYGVYGGESVQVQHLKSSAPLAARVADLPPYGFIYPVGQNPSTIYDFMMPTMEGEKPKWTVRSIRDRPRDPLIEAVAAHDKSTLRKVSELDRPSARPKTDERDPLLEQIRNKAFNLRPANALKPNIRGVPQTNRKVAAILEKANAIRQACAGSDEDDDGDGDNWSDT